MFSTGKHDDYGCDSKLVSYTFGFIMLRFNGHRGPWKVLLQYYASTTHTGLQYRGSNRKGIDVTALPDTIRLILNSAVNRDFQRSYTIIMTQN